MTQLPNGTAATATLTPSAGTTYVGVQIAGYSSLFALEQQLDLMAPPGGANYFENARGAGEKYLLSGNGSNAANGGYYILLPNGNLYAWIDNSLSASEAVPPIASLDTSVYNDPTLLTSAAPAYNEAAYNAQQNLDLHAPPNTTTYFYNARNAQEKYLISDNGSNAANGSYYILMPNGNLYAWVGNSLSASLANAPVATLPTAYYQNPAYLINAAAPNGLQVVTQTATLVQTTDITASINATTNTLTVTDTSGYLGTVLVYVTISDGALTTTQAFQVTFV